MKTFKIYMVMLLAFFMLSTTVNTAQAQDAPKKGWSKKAKGAAIGGGAGVVGGAVVGGTKGAIIGGVAGAAAGGLIGRKKDRKKDPVRHAEYTKKD
ncbi:YMGG-like glycine zipper-containing protein [Hymenobacter metallicola]|uniref:Glycine zipper domain-containing protein n=1 Tax=Hymenobacter metallicola TaxID=2563114 RepID=A0A4Z0PX93_9BACT|nr:YMGG-like glycine zipper-containing protein [Hymenobacter metallicola]TGE21042.1 hypothetical protein E5K02_23815 [Hymenobacter metallicola]